jgi:hypothetical protein
MVGRLLRTRTRKLRKLRRWKPLPGDNRWRHSRLRRLNAWCNELESVWISESAIVICSYVLLIVNSISSEEFGRNLYWSNRDNFPQFCLEWSSKIRKNLSHISRCPGWESNTALFEYKSKALPLRQPAQWKVTRNFFFVVVKQYKQKCKLISTNGVAIWQLSPQPRGIPKQGKWQQAFFGC